MLGLNDQLAAIHRARGRGSTPRTGSDESLVTVARLVTAPGADHLATVSVWGSTEIGGVPAVDVDYTDATTVRVLVRGGRPVSVIGPASEIEARFLPAVPFLPASETRDVIGRVVLPTWSGTWRADTTSWGAWNTGVFGGRSDAYQGDAGSSGDLYGLATFGDQIVNLGASSITRAALTLVGNGAGPAAWTAVVQGATDGTPPAGAPDWDGDTASGTVTRDGAPVEIVLPSSVRTALRVGDIKSLGLLALVGAVASDYGGTTASPPGWALALDYRVTTA